MRYSRVVLFLGLISAMHAQDLSNRIYGGAFTGRFHCGGQWSDFTFKMSPGTSLSVSTIPTSRTPPFSIWSPALLTQISTAAYVLRGPYDPKTGHFRLEPLRWASSHPDGFEMFGIEGTFDAANRKMQAKMLSDKCDAVEMAAPGQRLPALLAEAAPAAPLSRQAAATAPNTNTRPRL